MKTKYTGKELYESDIKELVVSHGEHHKRKELFMVEVNDLILRGVRKIKVKRNKGLSKVMLVFKSEKDIHGKRKEIGRISLYSTSEILIDDELGTYEIDK